MKCVKCGEPAEYVVNGASVCRWGSHTSDVAASTPQDHARWIIDQKYAAFRKQGGTT